MTPIEVQFAGVIAECRRLRTDVRTCCDNLGDVSKTLLVIKDERDAYKTELHQSDTRHDQARQENEALMAERDAQQRVSVDLKTALSAANALIAESADEKSELQTQFDSDGVISSECWALLWDDIEDPNNESLSVVVGRVKAERDEAKSVINTMAVAACLLGKDIDELKADCDERVRRETQRLRIERDRLAAELVKSKESATYWWDRCNRAGEGRPEDD
jgi:FtsZ-binding cell division protein ZapB